MITFTVLGSPQGKGRPKSSRRGDRTITYTPEQTVLYENLIKTEYRAQCGLHRFADDAALDMTVIAYYAIPKSASKKQKALMLADRVRPTKTPDADNVIKVVADSLNQVAYRDDAQIVSVWLQKYYSERPRLEVSMREVDTRGERSKIYFN